VSVSYLINRLQPLPFKTPLMVSLNPQREPKAER
jgi:predicted NAD/FAD-binding protein